METSSPYQDVTSLFFNASKDLKPGQMLAIQKFSLEDTMAAIEIADPKMDLKANLKDIKTIQDLIQEKIIKLPQDLSTRELIGIFDELLGKEMLWLSGQALTHTIYTFCYLYDPKLYENHPFLGPYVEAIHHGGTTCQNWIRQTHFLREEDYIASTVGFISEKKPEEVIKNLLKAEAELKGVEDTTESKDKSKKKKKKPVKTVEQPAAALSEDDALHARLELRRQLFILYTNLQIPFSPEIRQRVQNDITACQKALDLVKKSVEHSESCEKYFDNALNKTILAQIPIRKPKLISKTDAFIEVENMLNALHHILKLSDIQNFYDIQRALQSFSLVPKNLIARTYLDLNLFQKNEYFGLISVKELALGALYDFATKQSETLSSNPDVAHFVGESVHIFEEVLSINLRNRTKEKRETCKTYYYLNVLAHDAYSLDEKISEKSENKTQILFSWVLDIALKLMTRQLLQGFDLSLYAEEEYCIIFYFLDRILKFYDRTVAHVTYNLDREFMTAWQNKENVDKKKKKLTTFQRKYFYESLYYKAIEYYSTTMLKLSYLLIFKGIVTIPQNEEILKNRYYMRLRVFDNIYFLGKFEFTEFIEYVRSIEKADFDEVVKDCKSTLETTLKLLNEIAEEEYLDARIRGELAKLKRVCVMNSLAITVLSMNKNNLTDLKASYKNTEHPYYPVLELTKKAPAVAK